MVILGKLPLKKFPVYVLAQFLGAFAGSCAVYGLYYGEISPHHLQIFLLLYIYNSKFFPTDALMEYTNGEFIVTGQNATANIFASYPSKHLSVVNGFVDQVRLQANVTSFWRDVLICQASYSWSAEYKM